MPVTYHTKTNKTIVIPAMNISTETNPDIPKSLNEELPKKRGRKPKNKN